MVAGCGMTCIKYIVFAVNFLFFVMGVAAVALGIYALVDKNDMEALTKIDSDGKLDDFNAVGLLQSGAIVLIVGGAFLLVLGFLGCCGAAKESKCLLGMYSAVVILIIIIQIVAAGLAIAFRGRITDSLKDALKKGIVNNYDGNLTSSNAFSRAFDFAQVYFECCGVDSSDDFNGSAWFTSKAAGVNVPNTCCALKDRDQFFDDNKLELNDPTCPKEATGTANPNTGKGCYQSIEDWIVERAGIIIGIAIGIVIIEMCAATCSLCLCKKIGYDELV